MHAASRSSRSDRFLRIVAATAEEGASGSRTVDENPAAVRSCAQANAALSSRKGAYAWVHAYGHVHEYNHM